MTGRIGTWLALVLALAAAPAMAQQEVIHRFHSHIQVHEDGSMTVQETIRVTAAGRDIKRGIYRDFPTTYPGPLLTRIEVPFEVEQVLRDGRAEPWHTERRSNGVRVYIGDKDRPLPSGNYTYTVRYRTDRQLGYFDEHDELYWNITGNEWTFPIHLATAEIILPEDVPRQQITYEAYTGPTGVKGRAYESELNPQSGTVLFRTTRPLAAGEGLTIVVGWPRGFVAEPTPEQRRAMWMESNRALLYGLVGLVIVLSYYIIAWLLVGRDPQRGTIIPRFEPPMGLSPAAVRFVDRMGYDDRCFAAAVVDMAVKGVVQIEENNGTYSLKRISTDYQLLSPAQKQVRKHLLGSSSRVQLKQENHSRISRAIKALRTFLNLEYEGKLFYKNRRWLVPGLLLSLAAFLVPALLGASEPTGAIFMSTWLSIWTLGVFFLLRQVIAAWRHAFSGGGIAASGGALFITLFSLPFLAGEVFGLVMLGTFTSIWMIPLLLVLVGLNFAFFHWLKRPTAEGQRIRDEIEGFRMYLSAAEGDTLRALEGPTTPAASMLDAPSKTPELFEKYLPYALALGVENRWGEQFADVLSRSGTPRTDGDYHPAWYHGSRHWSDISAGAFATGLGASLAGAIASSSTAPGSSSGAGGSGSSGGGGGGGGGGGW